MNPTHVKKSEQIKLIMECRRSGLSDFQWCREHDILPRTFYNWVSKLKEGRVYHTWFREPYGWAPARQEVVKLDLMENGISPPAMTEQNACPLPILSIPCIAAEIECGTIRIRRFNGETVL